MTGSQRLEEVIKKVSFGKVSKFAESIGYTRQAIYPYLSGKKEISATLVDRILTIYPEVDGNWLRYGEGDMMREPNIEYSTNTNNNNKISETMTTSNEPSELKAVINFLLNDNARLRNEIHHLKKKKKKKNQAQ